MALRLGSYRLLQSDDVEPVLILDDVFAELDARRRRALAVVAAQAEQVVVTAAVAEDVPEELGGCPNRGEWRRGRAHTGRSGGRSAGDIDMTCGETVRPVGAGQGALLWTTLWILWITRVDLVTVPENHRPSTEGAADRE